MPTVSADAPQGRAAASLAGRLPPTLPRALVEEAVRHALIEDQGRAGDVTSQAVIPPEATATALFIARDPGVLAGLPLVEAAFRIEDPALRFEAALRDGATLAPGDRIGAVSGPARALLAAERVALNHLCRLSGIATLTAAFVAETAGATAQIVCTRKTTPGLRAFEKYAVRCGGATNHRFGLDDAILIKDNHIAVAGGVTAALRRAQAFAGHLMAIEIEVDTLAQLEEALAADARIVLLDNMSVQTLREAVALTAGRAVLEASGGVSIETVRAIAETGVDHISTSKITMSAPSLDIGLDIEM